MGKIAEFLALAGSSALAVGAVLLASKASDDDQGFGPVGRTVAVASGAAFPVAALAAGRAFNIWPFNQ